MKVIKLKRTFIVTMLLLASTLSPIFLTEAKAALTYLSRAACAVPGTISVHESVTFDPFDPFPGTNPNYSGNFWLTTFSYHFGAGGGRWIFEHRVDSVPNPKWGTYARAYDTFDRVLSKRAVVGRHYRWLAIEKRWVFERTERTNCI